MGEVFELFLEEEDGYYCFGVVKKDMPGSTNPSVPHEISIGKLLGGVGNVAQLVAATEDGAIFKLYGPDFQTALGEIKEGMSYRFCLCVIYRLIAALKKIHELGIFLVDVKPDNLLTRLKHLNQKYVGPTDGEGYVTITDFGLAVQKPLTDTHFPQSDPDYQPFWWYETEEDRSEREGPKFLELKDYIPVSEEKWRGNDVERAIISTAVLLAGVADTLEPSRSRILGKKPEDGVCTFVEKLDRQKYRDQKLKELQKWEPLCKRLIGGLYTDTKPKDPEYEDMLTAIGEKLVVEGLAKKENGNTYAIDDDEERGEWERNFSLFAN